MTLQPFVIRNLVLMLLMLVASVVAGVMRPTMSLADEFPPIDLEAMVPREFSDWREVRNSSTQLVNPQQRKQLELIYSQTLSRVYTNADGYRIMLSIAYGRDQKDTSQLHRPDLCYPAQGFQILSAHDVVLSLPGNELASRLLETQMGERVEPLTYWTVVGEHITTTGLDKKLAEMRYGLKGRIADGMIVRVSSIDRDSTQAYAQQAHFAADLVAAIAPEHRSRFAGSALTPSQNAQP